MTDIFASGYLKKLTKHIVKNNSAVFENRDGLQFTGNVTISDDSGNNNTIVNIPTTDIFTGATSSTNGQIGLVPMPTLGKQNSILKGNGTWGMSIYKGTITIGDVGGTSGSLPVSGDIISATAINGSAIDITISHPSVSANAIYNITIENIGNELYANDISQTVFTRISASQIRVYFEEISTSSQNIKLNIVIFD